MTILVDASAIVAIVHGEAEADDFADAIDAHNDRRYCAVGAWKAAQAIARLQNISLQRATEHVANFVYEGGLRLVPIGENEHRETVGAAARYGKGHHPARLNIGDCFAYACAKTNGAELLYKGDDFALTDLA